MTNLQMADTDGYGLFDGDELSGTVIKALTLMILIASGCEEKCGPDKNAMAKGSVVRDSNVSAVPEVACGDQCGNDKDGGCVFPDAASPTDAAFRKREFDWLRKVEFECRQCNAPETSSREIMEGLVK